MSFKTTSDGKKRVTLIPGDGIGPEVVDAAVKIIAAAGVKIEWDRHDAGESVFKRGVPSGVPQDTIESIRDTRVVLKGPLGTPIGYGEKSANVTLRKLFETYGNLRPVKEISGVKTAYSGRGIDLIIVRENVEDLYAGIEYMQTPGVAECLKLISRKGCEKIVRLGFEVARAENRKKVHCATKANIMKMTEGTLKRTFEEIAKEYPEITSNHIIVDNCAHQLALRPETFDVIIMTNMNGDILSDLTSGQIGGLGFAPSANLGSDVAIFEAVHGSAPKYAGKNVINPTALILTAVMLLRHLQEFDAAARIENSVFYTIEQGKVMTRDVVGDAAASSTTAYTDEIIKNLGKKPAKIHVRDYKPLKLPVVSSAPDFVKPKSRRDMGVDVFVETNASSDQLGKSLEKLAEGSGLKLKAISNRGTKVYSPTGAITDCVDHYACRFVLPSAEGQVTDAQIAGLVQKIGGQYRWMHLEKLAEFDGAPGYTKSQGED